MDYAVTLREGKITSAFSKLAADRCTEKYSHEFWFDGLGDLGLFIVGCGG